MLSVLLNDLQTRATPDFEVFLAKFKAVLVTFAIRRLLTFIPLFIMTKSIISLVLLLVSAFLSFKHGWDAFHPTNPEQERMMADIGIGKSMVPYVGVLSLLTGVLLLIPQTLFLGNVLNAVTIVLIMA